MQAGSKSLIALAVRAKRLRSLGLAGCRVGVRGSGDDGVTNAALAALAHCAANGRLACLRCLDLEHCRLVSAKGADGLRETCGGSALFVRCLAHHTAGVGTPPARQTAAVVLLVRQLWWQHAIGGEAEHLEQGW